MSESNSSINLISSKVKHDAKKPIPLSLNAGIASQFIVEHAKIEDIIDDDVPLRKFLKWYWLTQATLRFHIPRPTRTRQLLIHNSEYRGTIYIAQDAWCLPNFINRVPQRRFVSETTSKRFKDFSTSEEFYTTIIDVLGALHEGSSRCNWLHGDIRWDHMLIDPDGRGILSDYDLRKF